MRTLYSYLTQILSTWTFYRDAKRKSSIDFNIFLQGGISSYIMSQFKWRQKHYATQMFLRSLQIYLLCFNLKQLLICK